MASSNGILVEYKGKVAIITLNVPKKLNALDGALYYQLARAMHEVAARDDIYITVLTGKGRYFSAYVFPSPWNSYFHHSTKCTHNPPTPATTLTSPQRRRRRLRREQGLQRHRRAPSLAEKLRLQQPAHHPRLLHAPQDPRNRAQRPRRRPLRRPHRLLRLHLRGAAHLPTDALLVARPRRRGQREHRVRAPAGHREGQRGADHEQAHWDRGPGAHGLRQQGH